VKPYGGFRDLRGAEVTPFSMMADHRDVGGKLRDRQGTSVVGWIHPEVLLELSKVGENHQEPERTIEDATAYLPGRIDPSEVFHFVPYNLW